MLAKPAWPAKVVLLDASGKPTGAGHHRCQR
jgi:hypothetical protein